MSRISDRHHRLALIALAAAAAALSGCGRQGPLDRPAPLFGREARAQYEAEQAQAVRDAAQRAGETPATSTATGSTNAPATRREVQDPNQRLNPASTAPLPGAPNPFGAGAATPLR